MHLLDFIFPIRCVGCGRFGKYVCEKCARGIKVITPGETICPVCERSAIDGRTHMNCRTKWGIDGLTSVFHYDGVVKKILKTIKYRFASDCVKEVSDLVKAMSYNNLEEWGRYFGDSQFLAIPLHQKRLYYRGFNQSELLLRQIAPKFDWNLSPQILSRTRYTKPQVEKQTKMERLGNMRGVFAVVSRQPVEGKRFVLFDDVFTTGATMRAAANTLKRAGASWVWGMSIAR